MMGGSQQLLVLLLPKFPVIPSLPIVTLPPLPSLSNKHSVLIPNSEQAYCRKVHLRSEVRMRQGAKDCRKGNELVIRMSNNTTDSQTNYCALQLFILVCFFLLTTAESICFQNRISQVFNAFSHIASFRKLSLPLQNREVCHCSLRSQEETSFFRGK